MNFKSEWILPYIACPLVVLLSGAAIIYTFKELPKISVLKNSFDKQNEQVQNKLESQAEQIQNKFESQAEQIQKIKDSIILLAEKTDNLDAELVRPLISKVNDLNNNIRKSESRYLAETDEQIQKIKDSIILLAEKTDNLDAELVRPLISKVNDLDDNIRKSESRYLARIKEDSEILAAEIQYGYEAKDRIVQHSEFEKLKKEIKKLKKEIKKLKKEIKKLK